MTPDLKAQLKQIEIEKWFCEKYGVESWTTLYQRSTPAETSVALYACPIPVDRCAQSLRGPGWDLSCGSSMPQLSGDEMGATYLRLGEANNSAPIVILRKFHHGRQDYLEISEDLRLLFKLYEDRTKAVFYEVGEGGDETEVIKVLPDKIVMRTTLLRRYLAARQLALVLQIDSRVWLHSDSDAPSPDLPKQRDTVGECLCLQFYSSVMHGERPFSRLFGKKIILPPEQSECELWPFERPEEFLDFIIGEDARGHRVMHTCNPELLANHFGANPGVADYRTPVFFTREVLRRYYENDDRYEVIDGAIRQGSLWIFQVDTNHTDHVVAFLGDLGRELPQSERLHWRAYNVPPEDRQMSETAIQRAIYGQFAEPESPEHSFKQVYRSANAAWATTFGWPLFKELHADDAHALSSLRLPLSNSANEFDGLVLDLAKLVVDSINEEEISASLTTPAAKGDKGIAKLERLLVQVKYPHTVRDMPLLRAIQGTRSKGAAHRKGSDYDLAQAGFDPGDLQKSFRQLLEGVTLMLNEIKTFANSRGK